MRGIHRQHIINNSQPSAREIRPIIFKQIILALIELASITHRLSLLLLLCKELKGSDIYVRLLQE